MYDLLKKYPHSLGKWTPFNCTCTPFAHSFPSAYRTQYISTNTAL